MSCYPNESYESAEEEVEHLKDLTFELEQNYLSERDKVSELIDILKSIDIGKCTCWYGIKTTKLCNFHRTLLKYTTKDN